jgi:hypothetical protein
MKPLYILAIICLFYLATGCKKDSGMVYPLSLSGKWTLVKDSVAYGAAAIYSQVYNGISGDYFDFRNDGNCYVKEGGHYDTLTYHITSDTTLKIQEFGFGDSSTYSKPTNPYRKAVISSVIIPIPGGYSYRQVTLTR